MKKIVTISLLIIVISMIFVSGCTSHTAIATECNRCEIGSGIMEKTSVISLEKSDTFTDTPDGDRLHIKDSDGIIYNAGNTAQMMFDLDAYDEKNVKFSYHCAKNGYYQLIDIEFASQSCNCKPITISPTQTPKIIHTGCDYVCVGSHMNCTYDCEMQT